MINIKEKVLTIFSLISFVFIWKNGLKSYLKCISKYISPIIVIAFYIFDLSITRIIEIISPISFETILTTPTTRLAVDSALATLIFNFISFLVTAPAKIKVEFESKQRTRQVSLKYNKQSKIDININIDLKYNILMFLFKWLGDINISIINTEWTSIDIDRRDEYGLMINYDNPSQEILINCKSILDGNKSGKICLLLCVSPNITVYREGYIKVSLVLSSGCEYKKILFNFLKGFIIEVDFSKIELVNIDIKGGE